MYRRLIMKEILKDLNKIVVFKDNHCQKIDIKDEFIELIEGAYTTPSYAAADNDVLCKAREKGVWIELVFNKEIGYNEYKFEKLLMQLKPKYNFINFFRGIAVNYSGRCITLNLATNTTGLYKSITKKIEETNEK